jgi:hypothetical protein
MISISSSCTPYLSITCFEKLDEEEGGGERGELIERRRRKKGRCEGEKGNLIVS